ncbi:MAG: hypothetical protein ACYTEL_12385 [Planctomycetota bacterium]|jgi:hypothetical protein
MYQRREVEIVDGAFNFWHSTEAHFNADVGHVEFADGRVTNVEFHPD